MLITLTDYNGIKKAGSIIEPSFLYEPNRFQT